MTDDVSSLLLYAVCTLSLFCVCSLGLLYVLRRPVPAFNATPYTKAALRIKRAYGVFAWGLLTTTFLVGLVMSFVDVYTQL